MNDTNRHFDKDPDPAPGEKFSQDLRKLFSPAQADLSAVDRAVAEAARRHLRQPVRRRTWIHWTIPAAAAAAIALGCMLWFGRSSTPPVRKPVAAEDIDHNGKVDIVDAFQLARHVESGRDIDRMWDFNGDGVIDRKDVDEVAFAAVALDKGV
jgi:hypothetical protein